MNTQPRSPRVFGKTAVLTEVFHTIQGEGPHAGRPAVFVRFAGCNLQCPGCDTSYPANIEHQTAAAVLAAAADVRRRSGGKASLLVITGGEPFRQGDALLALLEEVACYPSRAGFEHAQVETNGTLGWSPYAEPAGRLISLVNVGRASVVVSPKTGKVHRLFDAPIVAAYKYVVDTRIPVDPADGIPTAALAGEPLSGGLAKPPAGVPVYLQPFDAGDAVANAANLRFAAELAMRHNYRLSVQMHKLAGLP